MISNKWGWCEQWWIQAGVGIIHSLDIIIYDHLGVRLHVLYRLVDDLAANDAPDQIDFACQRVDMTQKSDPVAVSNSLVVNFLDFIEAAEAVANLRRERRGM